MQTIAGILCCFACLGVGEEEQKAFLQKQVDAIERCLTPVVQAYYAGYNESLGSLAAICDSFRKNQKEVQQLAKNIEDMKGKLMDSHSGIQDLYYQKVSLFGGV